MSLTMNEPNSPDLPPAPEPGETMWGRDAEESETADDGDVPEGAQSTPDDGPPSGGDEDPFTKTYIALDGVEPGDLSDDDVDAIKRHLADVCLLDCGLPISGVRIVNDGETNVVELHDE